MRFNELADTNIGRYHVEALIGHGGMAAVYQACYEQRCNVQRYRAISQSSGHASHFGLITVVHARLRAGVERTQAGRRYGSPRSK